MVKQPKGQMVQFVAPNQTSAAPQTDKLWAEFKEEVTEASQRIEAHAKRLHENRVLRLDIAMLQLGLFPKSRERLAMAELLARIVEGDVFNS